ncbi:hypothetical protein [Paraburkholderia sp. RAU2J]|uniref:hypothetical protein n=1 Tax=Paraburkholderia sp. RAU2J TaxID=1938810 RepID=UPI0011C36B2F|nr:hypothetical protein [Paraburkholderia sp. RAU2J]
MKVIQVKDDFPAGFHDELGRLVAAWGRVEYLLMLCGKTLDAEGFTLGMRSQILKGKRLDEFCKHYEPIARAKLPELQAGRFRELLAQAQSLAVLRNDNVHAVWTTDDGGEPLRYRPKKNKPKNQVDWCKDSVPVCQLRDTRQRIEGFLCRLDNERKKWVIPPAN